jgi:hypothetical protein
VGEPATALDTTSHDFESTAHQGVLLLLGGVDDWALSIGAIICVSRDWVLSQVRSVSFCTFGAVKQGS